MTETMTAAPTATDLFRSIIMTATLAQVEAASVWYHDAQEVAEDVAENRNRR